MELTWWALDAWETFIGRLLLGFAIVALILFLIGLTAELRK